MMWDRTGKNNPNWRGGINSPGKIRVICKNCGEEFITKRYYVERGQMKYCSFKCRPQNGKSNPNWRHGKVYTKEYRRFYSKKDKHQRRSIGYLSVKTIQLVYEDNIKKYGTLTCYLCLEPIVFSKDHLEHKTPISRGGTNEYNNLAVACGKCNMKKRNKTEKEYRELIK